MYRTHRTPPGISTKTHPIPGHGYEVRTDLTELLGKGIILYRTYNLVGYGLYPGKYRGYTIVNAMFRRVRVRFIGYKIRTRVWV